MYTCLLLYVSTTVKISKDYKERLDRLQASLLLATGKKIPLQELLEMLVQLGVDQETTLQERVTGESNAIKPERSSKILKMPSDWGVETSEKTIDKIIYGDKK